MGRNLTGILLDTRLSEIDKNNLILDLAEIQDVDLYENIMICLNLKDFNKYYSVLIYALTFYPAEPLMEKAINWLMKGSFEIAHSAFDILNNIEEMSGDHVDKAFCQLTQFLEKEHCEDWRKNLIEDVVEMFD